MNTRTSPGWKSQADALKRAGDLHGAARAYAADARMRPDSAVAEHNLAATLGDIGDFSGAAAASARALAKGGQAPETWLVHARALQGMGEFDAADEAFGEAIRRRPDYAVAHRDLAQLRWMRSADPAAAMRALEAAPATPELALVHAAALIAIGQPVRAATVLDAAIARAPAALPLRLSAAATFGLIGRPQTQLEHATAALGMVPGSIEAAAAAVAALLHLGRVGEAVTLAERLAAAAPDDQGALSLLITAWRMAGDPRHAELCEDPALVSTQMIAVPPGWRNRSAFLDDLAEALMALHGWRTHPFEQSLRHGSQTQVDLATVDTPAIRALFVTLRGAIDAHLGALGPGSDPIRRRNTGRWRIPGAWSVRLMPGGFHTDHVHPHGWISSAFYVELPNATAREPEGWLALGRPGVRTDPALAPFRRIRPEPGLLALFPSYLWHGTEPFTGTEPRLTVAFDVVPVP